MPAATGALPTGASPGRGLSAAATPAPVARWCTGGGCCILGRSRLAGLRRSGACACTSLARRRCRGPLPAPPLLPAPPPPPTRRMGGVGWVRLPRGGRQGRRRRAPTWRPTPRPERRPPLPTHAQAPHPPTATTPPLAPSAAGRTLPGSSPPPPRPAPPPPAAAASAKPQPPTMGLDQQGFEALAYGLTVPLLALIAGIALYLSYRLRSKNRSQEDFITARGQVSERGRAGRGGGWRKVHGWGGGRGKGRPEGGARAREVHAHTALQSHTSPTLAPTHRCPGSGWGGRSTRVPWAHGPSSPPPRRARREGRWGVGWGGGSLRYAAPRRTPAHAPLPNPAQPRAPRAHRLRSLLCGMVGWVLSCTQRCQASPSS